MERLHRFGAFVKVRGRKEYCHVTNSGRLKELLVPGAKVALVDHLPQLNLRKTRYSVRLAFYHGKWVCIEANIAPRLVQEAWKQGRILELKDYDQLKAEVPLNKHTRFDFRAWNSKSGALAWIEVKCVTLVDGRKAGRFPDAPSERASKHLRELMALARPAGPPKLQRSGKPGRRARKPQTKCFVFFVLQNPLGRWVGPNDGTDPLFGETLRKASKSGVGIRAWRARIGLKSSEIVEPVPVLL